MTPAEKFLSQLHRVRRIEDGVFNASCPTAAHPRGDRSAGLRIKELSDGMLLIHCFSGCTAAEITEAIGLTLSDLYPENPRSDYTVLKRRNVRDRLLIIRDEALLVSIAASQIETLSDDDVVRVREAGERIRTALGD